jgi:3-phenylpropionate/trans-cinnamate dioxygenase ferredoxin reductase component
VLTGGAGVVIVGAGHAGFAAAAALREAGYSPAITLISDEPDLPYQRPPLSKSYLLGKVDRARVAFRPEAFYGRRDIVLRRGQAVTGIDRHARRVHLDGGDGVDYDVLVLATGAAPRDLPIPGRSLPGVHHLRSASDSDDLRAKLDAVGSPVVVGGGFIGLEFAAVAAARGTPATILEAAPRLLSRSVSEQTAQALAETHERWGNTVVTRAAVTRIAGDPGAGVTGVELASGEVVPADLVIVGVGAQPRTAVAEAAGLAVEDGIVVDHYLRTTDPAVCAIGDCARFATEGSARGCRRESVQNATDQARTVARTICGEATPYTSLPWFWSDQGDLKLQIAGDSTGHDAAITVPGSRPGSFSTYCFWAETLIAVESVNSPPDHVAARKVLADPAVPTRAMLSPTFDLPRLVRERAAEAAVGRSAGVAAGPR